MADVADILGVRGRPAPAKASEGKGKGYKPKKPKGMSREVYNLVGDSGLAPMMPSRPIAGANGAGASAEGARPASGGWVLRTIQSSARSDQPPLKHWEHAGLHYPDYPYARFNRKVTVVRYTDEEYARVHERGWSREETDLLFDFCERFDLRWLVIADRCRSRGMARSVEEMKERFYTVTAAVLELRGNRVSDPDPFVSSLLRFRFDRGHEERRRQQLDKQLRRAPSEELEEERLIKEQRQIDKELKRLQKELKQRANSGVSAIDGVPVWPTSRASYEQYLVSAAPGASGMGTLQAVDAGPPGSVRGSVYLRSRRFKPPPAAGEGGVLAAKVLEKIGLILAELGVPEQPVATGAVLEAYDRLRQDILKMLSLKKHLSKQRQLLRQVMESRTLAASEAVSRHPTVAYPPGPGRHLRPATGSGSSSDAARRNAKRSAPAPPGSAAKRSRK